MRAGRSHQFSRRFRARRGCLPTQSREPRKVAVESDPLAPPFDSKGREPGIGDAGPARLGFNAEPFEDLPVSFARFDDLAIGLFKEIFAKSERFRYRAWHLVKPWIAGDPNNSTQSQR